MREIKFRVWGIEFKQYFYDIAILSDGTLWIKFDEDAYDGVGVLNEIKDEFILEQFTGLYDKNGVEIFEGDILKAGDKFIYEVVFDQHTCSFMLENKYGRNNLTEPKGRHYEVIGNVHEEVSK